MSIIINVSFQRSSFESYSYLYEGVIPLQKGDMILDVPTKGKLTQVYVRQVDVPRESLNFPYDKLARIGSQCPVFRQQFTDDIIPPTQSEVSDCHNENVLERRRYEK